MYIKKIINSLLGANDLSSTILATVLINGLLKNSSKYWLIACDSSHIWIAWSEQNKTLHSLARTSQLLTWLSRQIPSWK